MAFQTNILKFQRHTMTVHCVLVCHATKGQSTAIKVAYETKDCCK